MHTNRTQLARVIVILIALASVQTATACGLQRSTRSVPDSGRRPDPNPAENVAKVPGQIQDPHQIDPGMAPHLPQPQSLPQGRSGITVDEFQRKLREAQGRPLEDRESKSDQDNREFQFRVLTATIDELIKEIRQLQDRVEKLERQQEPAKPPGREPAVPPSRIPPPGSAPDFPSRRPSSPRPSSPGDRLPEPGQLRVVPPATAPSNRTGPVDMTLLAVWSDDAGKISDLQSALRTANRNELEQIAARWKSDGSPALLISAKALSGKKVELRSFDQSSPPGNRNSSSVRTAVTLQPVLAGGQASIAFSIETASPNHQHALQMESHAVCSESVNEVLRISAGEGHWLVAVRGVVGDEAPPSARQRQPATPRSRFRQEAAPQPEQPRPDRSQPDRSRPEREQPDRSQPDRSQPDRSRPTPPLPSRSRDGDRGGDRRDPIERTETSGRTSLESGDDAIRAYFTELVTGRDNDGDKKLSRSEIESWKGYEDFDSVDADGDRLLSADELILYFTRSGTANVRSNENEPPPVRGRNGNDGGRNETDS